jgi:putative nucleotidyltransferase with HDIG domain
MIWNFNALVPLITFFIYAVLLFVVMASQPQTAARRNFRWFLLSMSVYALTGFFLLIDTSHSLIWMRIFAASGIPLMISLFYFTQTIIEEKLRYAWLVMVYGLIVIVLSLTTDLAIVSAEIVDNTIHSEWGQGFFFIAGPSGFLVLFSIYLLIRSYNKSHDVVQRNRLLYLIIALSIIPLISLINFTPLGIYPLDFVGYGVTALLIAYTILRYQLLDIRIVIRQGLLYSIPTVIIGTTYFLIITLFINIFGLFSGAEVFLTSFVVAVITALLAEPLRVRAQAIIDRMFFREKYDSTQMLRTLSGSVATILDIYKITAMILDEVCSTLHIPMAAFYLRDQITGRFQLTTQHGLEGAKNIEFRQGHPMVLWLLSHSTPLTRSDMDVLPQFQSLWKSERQDLEVINAELFIPIKVHDALVGIFLVGSKRSEQAYTMEDILTLSTVANQTAVAIENARLYTSEQTRLQEMDVLYSMARRLVTTDNLEDVVQIVAQHAVDSVQATYARILTREENGDYICRAFYSLSHPIDNYELGKKETLVAEHYYNWIMQGGQPEVVLENDPDLHPEERSVLFLNGANSICLSPLKGIDENIGLLVLGDEQSQHPEAFPSAKLRLINVISDYAASAIQRAILHERLEETFLETIIALANAVDARDSYTGDHSQRIAELSTKIGTEMNLSKDEIEALHWAGILHDIGKIGVPDQILNKQGPLTKEEWVIMKEHPVIGAQIVAPIKYLAKVSPIIQSHHEKVDGTGYPYGLEGEDIPLGSRILSVVDAYIAIRDKRIYSKAQSHEEAIAELRRASGTQFDPYIVDVFCKTITE